MKRKRQRKKKRQMIQLSPVIKNNIIKQLYKCSYCSLDIVQLTLKHFLRAGVTCVIKMYHGTRPVCPNPSTPRKRSVIDKYICTYLLNYRTVTNNLFNFTESSFDLVKRINTRIQFPSLAFKRFTIYFTEIYL